MIKNIITSSGNNSIEVNFDFQDAALGVDAATQSTLGNLFWLRPYKSTDYPMITCDKDYFWIYSTDHDNTDGGVNMGKGNNLDLSDFQEIGTIFSGYQIETPFLVVDLNVGDSEVVHLFAHTDMTDPINQGQETRLFTTTGGDLVNSTWTDRGNPLGLLADEVHTGYFKPFWNGNYWVGMHLSTGGVPPNYRFSTSPHLRTWTRGSDYDLYAGVPTNFRSKPSHGWFFDKYNKHWWIGTIEHDSSNSPQDIDKNIIVAECDANYQIQTFKGLLNNGEFTRNYEVYIEGNTAHIYYQNPTGLYIWYSNWDLRMLQNL